MRMLLIVVVFLGVTVLPFGCDTTPSADKLQRDATAAMTAEAHKTVGMPDITNWQEKKLARDIQELRDKANLPTWTYIVDLNGKLHLLGRSIGYGLPYSVQFTNPQRRVGGGVDNRYIMPQAEANGLFMPDGLSATWVLLLNPDTGKPQPVYVEQQIMVSPFPLKSE